ncbi:hypothetical protein GCM10009821_23220 [Aeromicrobium halocynthiae]|uniref:Transposase n=1 Tax=Aeromicrobium halocynthiae TaxID=560557 RepID=A0ABN2W647_9ACTN
MHERMSTRERVPPGLVDRTPDTGARTAPPAPVGSAKMGRGTRGTRGSTPSPRASGTWGHSFNAAEHTKVIWNLRHRRERCGSPTRNGGPSKSENAARPIGNVPAE